MSVPTFYTINREIIEKHFQRHKRFERAINIYEVIIRKNPNADRARQAFWKSYETLIQPIDGDIIQSSEDALFVETAARISVWKEKYNKEKNYMNSIMEKIENGIFSYKLVMKKNLQFKRLIENQYHKLLAIVQPSDEYTYDKYVDSFEWENRKHFTYIEEGLLLESLHLWKKYIKPPCDCRVCALIHLNSLAETFAKDMKRTEMLKLWEDREVETWLYEFEIRHKNYISENFPPEEQCRIGRKVSPQIPRVRSGKKSKVAKDKPSTSKSHKSQPSSTSTKAKSSLPIQRSASSVVRSGKKSEYAKDKPSTSKLQPSSTSTKAKSSLPIQRSAFSKIDRKKIKNCIQTFKLVKPALENFLKNNKNEREVAEEYKFKLRSKSYKLFKETVEIVKDRKNYYNIKDNINKDFEAVSSGDMDLFTIAREYDINNYLNLFEQYKKYEKTKPSNKYVYNRYTFFGTFKYDQLRSIRRKFIKWSRNENKVKNFCSCRTCALEHLLDEVNASNIKISFPYLLGPQTRNYFKEWFQEVNIMFSVYPNNFPIKDCKKDQPQPSSSSTEFIDSSNLYVAPNSSAMPSSSQSLSYTEGEDSLLDLEMERELNYSQA